MTHIIDKHEIKKFYDEVGSRYPEEEIVYRTLRGILRKRFIESWLANKRGLLLDIGTGEGVHTREYNGGNTVGVDISPGKLRKAKSRMPENKNHTSYFIVTDAEDLYCIRPSLFDVILCSEIIEHLLHPEALWSAVSRLLKPGGIALITCPNYRNEKPLWTEAGILEDYNISGVHDKVYYHTAYTPEELALFAEHESLRVLEKGTLEREVKPAVIAPVVIVRTADLTSRLTGRKIIGRKMKDKIIDNGSLIMYYFLRYSGLLFFMLPFFKNGVRSYIVVKKTDGAFNDSKY